METHGKNPLNEVVAIIPARFESTRLPGKLLLDIGGEPVILRTYEQVRKARSVSRVLVATDDRRILEAVSAAGGEAVMTSPDHPTGSDRIAEAAEGYPDSAIIVNVQGDEPLISPSTIDLAVASMLESDEADICTTCEAISDPEEVLNADVVKVVTDGEGYAIYFSRSPVPYPRKAVQRHGDLRTALSEEPGLVSMFKGHTGIYVYRHAALRRFCAGTPVNAERSEALEQLRAIAFGLKIKVLETDDRTIGVDTMEDLELVRRMFVSRDHAAV